MFTGLGKVKDESEPSSTRGLTLRMWADKKQIYGGRIYNLIYKDGTKKTFILSSNDREQLTLEYDGIRYVTSSNIQESVMQCFGK